MNYSTTPKEINQQSKEANLNAEAVRVLHSADLFAGHKRLTIQHNEFMYTLRITRDNKLILTK
ncbi:hemin uptake protein HemP [Thiomicrorhabdus aquaedulcis]|uniref:hemin uptake protein HemP n=1 Tax=Thiomicrorhabdus aquaedulcis TaxID=2211106 RepID=UPI000FD9A39F|nr:hemin uptake protein HemP [Thiomicrorhabdus aquaedulcis]